MYIDLCAMVTNMTFLTTNKMVIIIGYHVHCGGDKVAVTCAVFSVSTSSITSDKVLGSFLYTFSATLCVSLRPLTKMQMAAVSLLRSHLFNFHLEMMCTGCYCPVLLLLDFHKMGCVSVNICFTKFQAKFFSNIIPALTNLECFTVKVVG